METNFTVNHTSFLNITNGTSIDNRPKVFMYMIMATLAVPITILNMWCLVILAKDKKLKEKRFDVMVICLSVSDSATGLLASTFSIQTIVLAFNKVSPAPPFCFIGISLLTATFLFSLLQILWICAERLFATFPMMNFKYRKIPVIPITVVLYAICVALIFTLNSIIGNVWSSSCKMQAIYGENRRTALEIFQPVYLTIVAAIVLIYVVIVIRIFRSKRKVNPYLPRSSGRQGNEQTTLKNVSRTLSAGQTSSNDYTGPGNAACSNDSARKHNDIDATTNNPTRPWKVAITLGFLILALLLAVTPKVIVGLAVVVNPDNSSLANILEICDLFLLLNPLLDPIIYVLRIRKFRKRLTCVC